MVMPERIAVTGMGCLCAAGATLDQALLSMYSEQRNGGAATTFTTNHSDPYPVFAVDVVADPPGLNPEMADLLRTSRLGLAAAHQALQQSGWCLDTLRELRVGVCMGTTVGSAMNNESFYRGYRNGETPAMAPIQRFLHSNPAAVIRRHFGFSGPCQTIVNACSSGTDAIGLATQWLKSGLCDVVLAGGADELCRTTYNGFASLQISAPVLCRPFSGDRCGLNLGEGGAVLVLESAAVRQQRRAIAQGFVLAYGSGSDGWHLTAPHPEGRGLKQALGEAFANSGIAPTALSFVNTHGTGTRDNDRVECLVLAEWLPDTPFHSTKGYTGHTLGAAGAIEAAFTLAFLQQRKIPASAGFSVADPEMTVTPVRTLTPIVGEVALSESLAFGGNNAVLILERGEVA